MAADVSGFKSFEEWAAANKAAGGRGLMSAYVASGGTPKAGEADQFNVGRGRADGSNADGSQRNNQADMTEQQRVDYAMQNIDNLDAHGDSTRAREQWTTWQRSYDPACPGESPYQAEDGTGCVEKPDNSNDPNAGGRQNLPGGGSGNPRGRGGQGQGGPGATNGGEFDGSYLQRGLMDLASRQGGMFSGLGADNQNAVALSGGGVFTAGDPNAQGGPPAPLAPPAPRTAPVQGAPTPAAAPAGGGGGFAGGTNSAALTNAWAPFSTGSGAAATTPGLVSKPAAPLTPGTGSTGPAPNVAASLQAKFPNRPGAWWQS